MIGNIKQCMLYLSLQDDSKTYEVKEYKEKRSLNANSYYWVLLSKLARILNISNEEAHFKMIKSYSNCYIVPLKEEIEPSNVFKYYEYYNKGTINGIPAIQYMVYQRSSNMNTKEFSKLLDGLVSECKELEIETKTPEELAQLEGYEK